MLIDKQREIAPELSVAEGAFIDLWLREGEKLSLITNKLTEKGITTATLKAVYYKEAPAAIAMDNVKLIGKEVDRSFREVDHKTIIIRPHQ